MTVAAMVIAYRPDASALSELLSTLETCFDDVYLIDNGGATEAMATTPFTPSDTFSSNVGLPLAANRGIQRVKDAGHEWIVHFDQDSTPSQAYASINEIVAEAEPADAWLAADYREAKTGELVYSEGRKRRRPFTPIASGSALRIAAVDEVGRFNTDYPVDLFDFDLALRLQRAGWTVRVDERLSILHSVGDRTTVRTAGLTLIEPGHDAWRTYLKLVATRTIVRDHLRTFPTWTVRHLLARSLEMLTLLLSGDTRSETLDMISRVVRSDPPPQAVRLADAVRSAS